MAQKINPNAFRLGSKLSWWSISHYRIINTNLKRQGFKILHDDLLIRRYVESIFKSFDIFVSEIIISRRLTTLNEKKNGNTEKKFEKLTQISKDYAVSPNKLNNLKSKELTEHKSDTTRGSLLLNHQSLTIYKEKNEENSRQAKEIITISFLFTNCMRKPSISTDKYKYQQYLRNICIFTKNILENILNTTYSLSSSNSFNNIIINLDIREVPNPSYNVKILGDYMGSELYKNPRKHKVIIKQALNYLNTKKNINIK